MRNRFLLLICSVLVLLALFGVWLIHYRSEQYRIEQRRALVRSNMRSIILAMEEYFGNHGSFPYSPRGSDYALYKLHTFIDASYFDADPKKDPGSISFNAA